MSATVSSVNRSVSAARMRAHSQSAGAGTPTNGDAPPNRSVAAHINASGTPTTAAPRTTIERTNWNVREPTACEGHLAAHLTTDRVGRVTWGPLPLTGHGPASARADAMPVTSPVGSSIRTSTDDQVGLGQPDGDDDPVDAVVVEQLLGRGARCGTRPRRIDDHGAAVDAVAQRPDLDLLGTRARRLERDRLCSRPVRHRPG